MKVLIYSLNFSPELTATGKYTGDMAAWLVNRGHEVNAIVGMPHYPQWSLFDEYSPPRYRQESISGVDVYRVPHYIPEKSKVSTFARVRMELSFIRNSLKYWWRIMRTKKRYDVVVVVCPPLFTAFYPMLYKLFRGVPWVLHVQDVQIDVAVSLGMIKNRFIISVLRFLEMRVLKSATLVSTISTSMRNKLEEKSCISSDISLIENWADPNVLEKNCSIPSFRNTYEISQDMYVIMYSGNLGKKQGIEIIVDVADRLSSYKDIQIVLVGDGAAKEGIVAEVDNRMLTNISFFPVQSETMLPCMLVEADLHLVIQKNETTDSVLPSKLANIMASARPCIVTASEGSDLYDIVFSNKLGVVVEPDNLDEIVRAILSCYSDPHASNMTTKNAECYARQYLDMNVILHRFENMLESIAVDQ